MEDRGASQSQNVMTTGQPPMDEWKNIPWKKIERSVFKLQKRIYQASLQDDRRKVHRLQRLLAKSHAGRLLAVRRVTQDNQGKKTAGVDGRKSLTPKQRLRLSKGLKLDGKAQPVRRVYIPKPGTTEERPLGIPTITDRSKQALGKLALEPEWEARFEPNSYGFRPGRSCHDAIEAIFKCICKQAKWVLDADIAKCFDRIAHEPLLEKLQTFPAMRRQIRAWLKAGVMDHGELFPTTEGSPQGGCISPLLANIALHGLEEFLVSQFPQRPKGFYPPHVVRYADDFVVLHKDRAIVEECLCLTQGWLKEMGLTLKPEKTQLVHTLEAREKEPGFDFLGFHIRQYPAGKTRSTQFPRGRILGFKALIKPSNKSIKRHLEKLKDTLHKNRSAEQELLIKILSPQIVGWCAYFASSVCKQVFQKIQEVLFHMLFAWAVYRHPNKGKEWIADKYWRHNDGQGWIFRPRNSTLRLPLHGATRSRRHIKVAGQRTPYDGDWLYWSTRMGREPTTPTGVARLLKEQKGRCQECGLYFRPGDKLEIDHVRPRAHKGTDARENLQLLHRHCHDRKSARDREVHMKSAMPSRSRVMGNYQARF